MEREIMLVTKQQHNFIQTIQSIKWVQFVCLFQHGFQTSSPILMKIRKMSKQHTIRNFSRKIFDQIGPFGPFSKLQSFIGPLVQNVCVLCCIRIMFNTLFNCPHKPECTPKSKSKNMSTLSGNEPEPLVVQAQCRVMGSNLN